MKWFLNLPQWARLAIAILLTITAFLGIWRLHEKRQAAEAVWATGERAVEHARSKLPLKVYVDQSFGSHRESAFQAIDDMDDATCLLMTQTPDPDLADIHIRHEACDKDADTQPNHPGCAWLDPNTGQVIIQVGQPGDITTSYLIFFHELTHAWGLAHDGAYPVPEKAGDALLFVPITANNASQHAYRLEIGKPLPRLSDKDEAALEGRYCESQTP